MTYITNLKFYCGRCSSIQPARSVAIETQPVGSQNKYAVVFCCNTCDAFTTDYMATSKLYSVNDGIVPVVNLDDAESIAPDIEFLYAGYQQIADAARAQGRETLADNMEWDLKKWRAGPKPAQNDEPVVHIKPAERKRRTESGE